MSDIKATIKRNSGDGNKWWARDENGIFIDKDKYRLELISRLRFKGYTVDVVGE